MADKKKKVEKKKEAPKILYHYCSNNAFHSIIENKSIRLSSLSLSNDSKEGKLVTEIIGLIAKADGLDQTAMDILQEAVSILEQGLDGLGFCLSEKGDLLSQWRGYADDATGVSIGFSKDYLEQLAKASRGQKKSGFSLQKVEYDHKVQESLIKPTYIELKKIIDLGLFKMPTESIILTVRSDDEIKKHNEKITLAFASMKVTVLFLFEKLFLLKTKEFHEELEWRLLSYFVKKGNASKCFFRALNDRIVPFREYELLESESDSIVEVILGPKNTTPDYVIESFLKQSGFPNVNISHSEASYR